MRVYSGVVLGYPIGRAPCIKCQILTFHDKETPLERCMNSERAVFGAGRTGRSKRKRKERNAHQGALRDLEV